MTSMTLNDVVNNEHISQIFLEFIMLTFSMYLLAGIIKNTIIHLEVIIILLAPLVRA